MVCTYKHTIVFLMCFVDLKMADGTMQSAASSMQYAIVSLVEINQSQIHWFSALKNNPERDDLYIEFVLWGELVC